MSLPNLLNITIMFILRAEDSFAARILSLSARAKLISRFTYCYSLQNPKNFRMREPCEFSNDRWPDVR